MLPTPHPEVLAEDWLPPVVLGREAEVLDVVRRLDPPSPRAAPPWIVAVVGTRGSGTSAVARRAAREVADRLRAERPGAIPRVIHLRVTQCRGAHGVASELLRALDDGFDGRGFPLVEVLAGFLRRVRRTGRPIVLVLDDVRPGGADIAPTLRAIGAPDRFLPEGETGLPPFWTIVAGTADAVRQVDQDLGDRGRIAPYVRIAPYAPASIRRLLVDRAERALGRRPPVDLIEPIVERTIAEGGGALRAVELLRRGLIAPGQRARMPPGPPGRRPAPLPIEARVVRAIEEASHGTSARLGEIRRSEARLARAEGASPLPPTTLWRRIVRLEQAGYVRRDVRPGGEGGTRSVLRVVAPVEEWSITPVIPETRPGSGAWLSPATGEGAPEPAGTRSAFAAPAPDGGAG